MAEEEKQNLLVNEDVQPEDEPPNYGSVVGAGPAEAPEQEVVVVKRWYSNVPGYGVYRMILNVHPYSHFVLVMMLLVYLLNQLDRYTLPVVTTSIGYDLQYGDKVCMKNKNISSTILNAAGNLTKFCTVDNQTSFYDDLNIL